MKKTNMGRAVVRGVRTFVLTVVTAAAGTLYAPAVHAYCAKSTHTPSSIASPLITKSLAHRQPVNGGHPAPASIPIIRTCSAAALDSITRILRLKLYLDQYDYDDIVIAFNAGTTPVYNFNYDSRYLPGIGAAEGLASYSSDGVPLSINFLPLPQHAPEVVRLEVQAQNSGAIKLERTELDSLPVNYGLWLVDRYMKDSINLRIDSSYTFIINKADTASFGSYRFSIVVSNNPPPVKLVEFNATKEPAGAQLSWTMQNEADTTQFDVERSTDRGVTFSTIDSIMSSSAGTYTVTDRNPPAAWDDYRLKITDVNGNVTYSNLVTLLYTANLTTITGGISVFPNPTSTMLQLTIAGNTGNTSTTIVSASGDRSSPGLAMIQPTGASAVYRITIISMTGTVVKNVTSLSESWEDDVSSLKPGTYLIRVVNNADNSVMGKQTFIKL